MTAPRWYRSPWPLRIAYAVAAVALLAAVIAALQGRSDRRDRDSALEKADSLRHTLTDVQYLLTLSKLDAAAQREEKEIWKKRVAESDYRYSIISRRLDTLTKQFAAMPLNTARDTLEAFPVLVEKCNECERAREELAKGKAAADSARVHAEGETAALVRSDSIRAARLFAVEANNRAIAERLAQAEPPCRTGIPFVRCPSRKASFFWGVAFDEAVRLTVRQLVKR